MSEESPKLHVIAPEGSAGRVDRYLAEAFPALSRSRLKALIEAGHVRRAGAVLREPAEPVRPGVLYEIAPPAPVASANQPQAMALEILHEDSDLLVLNKPAGLVVHPAPGNWDFTLVNALLAHCGDTLPGIGDEKRPGIVHRLDKDTSGVMVVAKTDLALQKLSAAFAARDLDRAYLALCWGLPAPAAGEIEGAIGRDPRDRKRMAVRPEGSKGGGGKEALTRYRTLSVFHAALALLECRLATGRTHQIRVHLASKGHPLVGDPVYLRRIPAAARGLPVALRGQLLDFPRQALHAARLGFAHPRSGKHLEFHTNPPEDLTGLLRALEI